MNGGTMKDNKACHFCGQKHKEELMTPFPWDDVHCPYSPGGGYPLPPGFSIIGEIQKEDPELAELLKRSNEEESVFQKVLNRLKEKHSLFEEEK
jgi:hypothetical protein